MTKDDKLEHGWWAVAFLDLLGQKEAFLKSDFMPDTDDPRAVETLLSAVKDSLGAVRLLRSLLDQFQLGETDTVADDSPLLSLKPEQIAEAQRMKRRRVRDSRWSDGAVMYAPLWASDDHSPVMGLYTILATAAGLTMVQLAAGKPIRGGIDIGTGIEVDEQLFGAALVKAYTMESEVAQYPRVAVGDRVVEYLDSVKASPDRSREGQFARSLAERLRGLLVRDEDEVLVLDYAGAQALSIFQTAEPAGLLQRARGFALDSRSRFRAEGNETLFGRYSSVVRYLDARIVSS